MDLFESPQFSPPIIILQTVMEEVRHRSLPLYNRLKALIKSDDKNVWVFYNEFRSYVYLGWALLNLTSSGRQLLCVKKGRLQMIATTEVSWSFTPSIPTTVTTSGIRDGAKWYNTHLRLARPPIRGQKPPTIPQVILLTQDVGNRDKALTENIPCTSSMQSRFMSKLVF